RIAVGLRERRVEPPRRLLARLPLLEVEVGRRRQRRPRWRGLSEQRRRRQPEEEQAADDAGNSRIPQDQASRMGGKVKYNWIVSGIHRRSGVKGLGAQLRLGGH